MKLHFKLALYHLAMVIFLGVLFSNSLFAQNNLEKYWNYRHRLISNPAEGIPGFIVVGGEPGMSIPAEGLAPEADCASDWWMQRDKCPTRKGTGKVKFSDGTTHLSTYIAVLALEYRLLKDAGQNTEQTAKELYYALLAVERLDKTAETYLGQAESFNGFFIRDDINVDFYYDDKNKQYRFATGKDSGYDCIYSEAARKKQAIEEGNFVSQDQVISLLFSFLFVKELCPEAYYKDKKRPFGEMVELYSHLMVNNLRKNRWKVVGPEGSKAPGRWGGNCVAFASTMAETAERITEGKFLDNYQRGKSKGISPIIFSTFDWGYDIHNKLNQHLFFKMVVTTKDMDANTIAEYSRKNNQIVFPLAYAILNKGKLDKTLSKSDFEKLLNVAPYTGPCNGTPGCNEIKGWQGPDRWVHPGKRAGETDGHKCEWNGLDFMLLYNLYHYYYQSEVGKYKFIKIKGKSVR